MVSNVLVPYDGSELSEQALEFAIETFSDADISALYVVAGRNEPPEENLGVGLKEAFERQEEYGEEMLEEAKEIAGEHGVDLTTALEYGRPANTIVRYAQNNDVDHIVIGSHGRSRIERILIGSVTETVSRRSPVPVTIVR